MTSTDITANSIQEKKTDGHIVYYSFTAVALQLYAFIQDYKTECHFLPTSWRLKIMFRHFIKQGKISCSISLKRRDSMNKLVDVDVRITYSGADDRPLFASPTRLHCEGMLPGEEIHGSTGYGFPYGQIIFVGIAISIRYCHSESGSDSDASVITTDMKRI